MEIEHIREKIREGHYRYTIHAAERILERKINRAEIEEAISHGEIIEHYQKDKYSPSCLIYGKTHAGKHIHVQLSMTPIIWIVTVYKPDPDEWINYKIRRRKS
jgi:hypothetical protein